MKNVLKMSVQLCLELEAKEFERHLAYMKEIGFRSLGMPSLSPQSFRPTIFSKGGKFEFDLQ